MVSSSSFEPKMTAFGKPASSRSRRASMREPGEVARVEPDPDQLLPLRAQPAPRLDGVPDPLERVVGVDEEDAVARQRARVGHEGLELVVVEHHPGVGVGAARRDAVEPGRERVRGGGQPPTKAARLAARPPSIPCARRRPNSSTGSPRAARQTRAALVATSVWKFTTARSAVSSEHAGDDGARDAHERLVREDDRPLRHRVHVDVHARGGGGPRGSRGSKSGSPSAPRCSPRNARSSSPKRQCSTRSIAVLEPRRDGEAALEGILPEGERRTRPRGARRRPSTPRTPSSARRSR